MPIKDTNTLFKDIISKKYGHEIHETLLFNRKINSLFKKRRISEAQMLNLTELFNQKNNAWLKKWKISKADVLTLTELFDKKINVFLTKEEISEEDVLGLTELFNQKMNIRDNNDKIITIADLLKKADDLNSINEIVEEFPPRLFQVDDWENIDNDVQHENEIVKASNDLHQEKKITSIDGSITSSDDSGIFSNCSLSDSESMWSAVTPQLL